MNESAVNIFNVEKLQHLSYERSTIWANFFDSVVDQDDDREIDLHQLDEVFEDQQEDSDNLESMEDEVDEDKCIDAEVLRDITNSTRLAMMFSNQSNLAKLSETSVHDENHELIDLFNETLPVISEHNRHLKETGFDRILNTFDAKKIEEKVGGWLRRHNSLCGGDGVNHTFYDNNKAKAMFPSLLQAEASNCQQTNSDSDDSFNSGETARYIRSSRNGSLKNSTTMMIKTYRMVKSTRQALKDKYACAQDDDTETHLKKLRHRRRLAGELAPAHCSVKRGFRPHKYRWQHMTPSHAEESLKRKVYRKRTTSNSCSTMGSSSESEYEDNTCKRSKCRCKAHLFTNGKHRYNSSRRPLVYQDNICHHSESHSYSMSSSISSPTSYTSYRHKSLKRLATTKSNRRQFKMDSQCRCCGERGVSYKYKQFTDTSTEEWVVKNSCVVKNLQKLPSSEPVIYDPFDVNKIVTAQKQTPSCSRNNIPVISAVTPVTSMPVKTASKKEKLQEKVDSEKTKTNSKSKKKAKKLSYKEKDDKSGTYLDEDLLSPEDNIKDSSYDEELQMALRLSQELYEKEQMQRKAINMPNNEKAVSHDLDEEDQQGKTNTHAKNATSSSCDSEAEKPNRPPLKRQMVMPPTKLNEEVKIKTAKSCKDTDDNGMFIKPPVNWKSVTTMKAKTKTQTAETVTSGLKTATTKDLMHKNKDMDSGEYVMKNKKNVTFSLDSPAKKTHTATPSMEQQRQTATPKSSDKQLLLENACTPRQKFIETQSTQEHGVTPRSKITKTQSMAEHRATPRPKITKTKSTREQSVTPMLNLAESQPTLKHRDSSQLKITAETHLIQEHRDAPSTPIAERKSFEQHTATPRPKLAKTQSTQEHFVTPRPMLMETQSTLKQRDTPRLKVTETQTAQDHRATPRPKSKASRNINKELHEDYSLACKFHEGRSEDASVNETTFGRGSMVICNSTAVANDNLAAKRQIKRKDSNETLKNVYDESTIHDTESKRAVKETDNANKTKFTKSSANDTYLQQTNIRQEKYLESDVPDKSVDCIISSADKEAETQDRHSKQPKKKNLSLTMKAKQSRKKPASIADDEVPSCSNKGKKYSTSANASVKKPKALKQSSSSSNVSSTTLHSPDNLRSSATAKQRKLRGILIDSTDSSDDNDCTVVSSTTQDIQTQPSKDLQQQEDTSHTTTPPAQETRGNTTKSNDKSRLSKHRYHPLKGILIYTPQNPSLAPANSISNDGCFFHITKDHLSAIIGEKPAQKFLKYYIGRRRFNSNSTIYFRPPAAGVMNACNSTSSDSDTDDLESIGQYGDLYESLADVDATEDNRKAQQR